MKNYGKLGALVLALLLLACAFGCKEAQQDKSAGTPAGVFSPNANYEYLVGSSIWQLSAESQALMQQAFASARINVELMIAKCENPDETSWSFETDLDGQRRMYCEGKRVAIISDIDDTLVDGVHYTANIVGSNGDVNNVAFARFAQSEACTALPGAVEFVQFCVDSGIEFYYITNRYDQGYRIGQADSLGSYEASVGSGKGLYLAADGTEIGASIYQTLGKSFYDITLESMTRLGFPIDDQHLIVNDSKLKGDSKQPARDAIVFGCEAYANGQREGENASGSALWLTAEPHCVVMLLGDSLADFTDDFSAEGLDAVTRAELTSLYGDKWGKEWIVLPNAVYGNSINYAVSYGIKELLEHYDYTK